MLLRDSASALAEFALSVHISLTLTPFDVIKQAWAKRSQIIMLVLLVSNYLNLPFCGGLYLRDLRVAVFTAILRHQDNHPTTTSYLPVIRQVINRF